MQQSNSQRRTPQGETGLVRRNIEEMLEMLACGQKVNKGNPVAIDTCQHLRTCKTAKDLGIMFPMQYVIQHTKRSLLPLLVAADPVGTRLSPAQDTRASKRRMIQAVSNALEIRRKHIGSQWFYYLVPKLPITQLIAALFPGFNGDVGRYAADFEEWWTDVMTDFTSRQDTVFKLT